MPKTDRREPSLTPNDPSRASATNGVDVPEASDIVDAPEVSDTEAGHEGVDEDASKKCDIFSCPPPVVPPPRMRPPDADARNEEPTADPPVDLSAPSPSSPRPPSAARPGTIEGATRPGAVSVKPDTDVEPGPTGPEAGPTGPEAGPTANDTASERRRRAWSAARAAADADADGEGPLGNVRALYEGPGAYRVGGHRGGDGDPDACVVATTPSAPPGDGTGGTETSVVFQGELFEEEEGGGAPERIGLTVAEWLRRIIRDAPQVEGRPINQGKSTKRGFMDRHRKVIIGTIVCAIIIVVTAVSATVVVSRKKATSSPEQPPEESERFAAMKDTLTAMLGDMATALGDPSSPQGRALAWLADEDPLQVDWRDTEHLKQRFALATFFFATRGEESWVDDFNFLSGEHECLWNKEVPMYGLGPSGGGEDGLGIPYKGALCLDGNTTVNVLVVPENNLTGHLPEEIGLFRGLSVLGLWSNKTAGTLPSTLGNLRYLSFLGLFLNRLTGAVPSSLGDLSQLELLALHHNSLNGTIPHALGKLTNLKTFALGENAPYFDYDNSRYKLFTGTFPSFFNNFTSLEVLLLSGTHLTGTLPFTAGSLPQLRRIFLFHNTKLTGTIPEAIYTYHNLEWFDMEKTSLTGTLSSAIGNLAGLKIIHLRDSNFSGTLPDSITDLDQLEQLWIEGNSFSGTLPLEMERLKKLSDVMMQRNRFTGTLPESIGDLTSLEFLDLKENQFHGTVPWSLLNLNSLNALYLQNNSFSGDISFLCETSIVTLLADCYGDSAEVFCGGCCTGCCGDDMGNGGPIEGCYPE